MEASYGQTQAAFGRNNEDESLLVKFYKRPKENQQKSKEEGRPIFEDRLYIEIMTPGNKGTVVDRPIREEDKTRFPRHWDAYERRTKGDDSIEGTLLDEWPQVTRSEVEELRFFNIRTVEQLALMSDGNAQNIRGALTLKHKAAEFLDNSMSNDELQRQLKAQQKQIADLVAAQLASEGTPKKRGRPKKVATEG